MKKWKSQRGQGLTEYAVVLSLVALVAITGMSFFGGAIRSKITSIAGALVGDEDLYKQRNIEQNLKNKMTKRNKKFDGMKGDDDKNFGGTFSD